MPTLSNVSPSPGSVEDVRNFYDRYPYPRPIDGLEEYRQRWMDSRRRRADYHLSWPERPYREDQAILVAGCGTSQAAKHAVRWPAAQVTGIDISATSVACTDELRRRHNLYNLQVHQLPIEQVSDLGMAFDHIVCTGVLHHLADPDAGLSALRSVLKPDGAMHLMVYAPYGRAGLYMLQEYCRLTGIHATDEGIRELISTLCLLPAGHPLENLLRQAPDFRHEAALADALLHPRDRSYSVPQLFEFIGKAGLQFGRWFRQAPYTPSCGVFANSPQALRMARLSLQEQYAAVELLRGTMVRHSLVVHRSDYPCAQKMIDFAGQAWPGYIPIRMADTICVQDRLPAGAAGVLINQTHTYKDLLMPIDLAEKSLFDAIDGNRCIGDIAATQHDTARSFFERLWQYDQVVFDTSQLRKANDATEEVVKAA